MQVASRVKLPTQVQMPIAKPTENSMTFLPDGLIDSDEELIDGDNDDLKIRGDKREQRDDVINVGDVVAEPRAATRLRVRTAGIQFKLIQHEIVYNVRCLYSYSW